MLGAGISGLTSALLLQALGWSTTIYADAIFGEDAAATFASRFPAASIIPHSVTIPGLASHQRTAQTFFEVLRHDEASGVRCQRHYEVFEQPVAEPAYLPALHDVVQLPDDGSGVAAAPRRTGADALFGWHFRCYFAETPVYLPYLARRYRAAGGTIERRHLTPSSLTSLPADILVNASGYGAPALFDDPVPHILLRGHLVRAAAPDLPRHPSTHRVFSYNYQPPADVYARADGSPADVYCYPRTDGWLLGGSRQRGHFDSDGSWQSRGDAPPTCELDDVRVPERILTLNQQLLRHLLGIDVLTYPLDAMVGIRYVRAPGGEGVRLEAETHGGRLVLHNYGHGGAGVALSWSCALEVARLLHARIPPPTCPPPNHPTWAAIYRTARRLMDQRRDAPADGPHRHTRIEGRDQEARED